MSEGNMVTVRVALEEFLEAGQADGLRPATLTWYASIVGAFVSHFEHTALQDITTKDLRRYIIDLRSRGTRYVDAPQKPPQAGKLSEQSIAAHIRALHAFWGWAAREYDIKNPMQGIKRPPRHIPQPRAIDPKDFVKLFEATADNEAGVRDRALLCVLADTGCRLGGLLSLTLRSLNLPERRATVTEKGYKQRTIVFTTYTARMVDKWLLFRRSKSTAVFVSVTTGDPLTVSGVNQILKRLKARAGVQGRVNPHSFRHNFAREYLKNGGDLVTLARLLGHADINTTASYYAVFSVDELADFHQKFSPLKSFEAGGK